MFCRCYDFSVNITAHLWYICHLSTGAEVVCLGRIVPGQNYQNTEQRAEIPQDSVVL